MDYPTKHTSYEILDPVRDSGVELTTDDAVAKRAFNRGFIVLELETVEAYVSTGQKITTTLTTEWKSNEQ